MIVNNFRFVAIEKRESVANIRFEAWVPLDATGEAIISGTIVAQENAPTLDYELKWDVESLALYRDRGHGRRLVGVTDLNQLQSDQLKKLKDNLTCTSAVKQFDEDVLTLVHELLSKFFSDHKRKQVREELECE